MNKIASASHMSGTDVKYYHPGPTIPTYTHQRTEADKKINDPASACFTSCRYPIPSVAGSRVRSIK